MLRPLKLTSVRSRDQGYFSRTKSSIEIDVHIWPLRRKAHKSENYVAMYRRTHFEIRCQVWNALQALSRASTFYSAPNGNTLAVRNQDISLPAHALILHRNTDPRSAAGRFSDAKNGSNHGNESCVPCSPGSSSTPEINAKNFRTQKRSTPHLTETHFCFDAKPCIIQTFRSSFCTSSMEKDKLVQSLVTHRNPRSQVLPGCAVVHHVRVRSFRD